MKTSTVQLLAVAALFVSAAITWAGCSPPVSPSPSPTQTPTSQEINPSPPKDWMNKKGEPGKVYWVTDDGEWVEVTVGSVVGMATKTDHGTWIWPNVATVSCGDNDKYAHCLVRRSVNPETGEVYIAEIIWKSQAEAEAEDESAPQ
jgi:hypothetical protein